MYAQPTPEHTGEALAPQVQEWLVRLGYGHLDCWGDPELLAHLHSHAMQALDTDGVPEDQLAPLAVARVADTLVVLYGGTTRPAPAAAEVDMHGVVAIAEAYQLGDAITCQIGHLLELWANPGMEDTWGLNINAVTRIEEKLLPVLRQYAPTAASELEQAIDIWKEG